MRWRKVVKSGKQFDDVDNVNARALGAVYRWHRFTRAAVDALKRSGH